MPPFQIDLYPSKLFLRITVVLYVLAVIAVWLTAFPFVVSFVITLILALSLFWNVKKLKQASSTLKYAGSEWKLTQYNNSEVLEIDVKPVGEILIHRWLIVVAFIESDVMWLEKNKSRWLQLFYKHKNKSKQQKYHTLLIFPDSTDDESHRRLRVALQYTK